MHIPQCSGVHNMTEIFFYKKLGSDRLGFNSVFKEMCVCPPECPYHETMIQECIQLLIINKVIKMLKVLSLSHWRKSTGAEKSVHNKHTTRKLKVVGILHCLWFKLRWWPSSIDCISHALHHSNNDALGENGNIKSTVAYLRDEFLLLDTLSSGKHDFLLFVEGCTLDARFLCFSTTS